MTSKCKLCLKHTETYVKILGVSEITKAIDEIFHIKINETNTQSIEILCVQCHNTVAEFYVFYNNIKETQQSLKAVHIKEESDNDYEDYDAVGLDDEPEENTNIHEEHLSYEVETDIKVQNEPLKIKDSVPGYDDEFWWHDLTDQDTTKKLATAIRKPRKVQIYFCDICGRDFKKYNFMKAHILQKHLGVFEDVCPHCGKTSFDKSTLKRHIEAVHLKTYKRRRDICPDCGVSVVALKLHRQLKHGIGPKIEKLTFTCDICSSQYTKLMYLKRHISRKHLKQFKDKCPFCQKDFYNRMSVERHMQSQHPDLVPEEIKKKRLLENITSPCDVCEKVFHRRANYLRHRRTVHKEVPFNVPVKVKPEFSHDNPDQKPNQTF